MISLSRNLFTFSSYIRFTPRLINRLPLSVVTKHAIDQLTYIKSVLDRSEFDWTDVKNNVLSIQGSINSKNYDAVLLKMIITDNKLDAAVSFANHLRNSDQELSLGQINGLLSLYYRMGKENKLSENEKNFILNSYKNLYEKYKLLDYTTCERLLHALCVVNEWEKAFKVLDDISLSDGPTHSAYNILIATLFNNDKKTEALELIQRCIRNKRKLRFEAYEAWINYILRKYKTNKSIAKHLDKICENISINYVVIDSDTATKLKDVYNSIGWNTNFTTIRKHDGYCRSCRTSLELFKLSDDEFKSLQAVIKDKLIVGSDQFLKTSPTELSRFLKFMEKNAPFDIVLDGLNIAYAANKGFAINNRSKTLNTVVDYFTAKDKKILLLGRKHMLNWRGLDMDQILHKTCSFFTADMSQDDPYFIAAAILSGPHADIVSKDLLRGHNFLLKDEKLTRLFKRWQWEHQWMVFLNSKKGISIQTPLTFTPCAQMTRNTWHLPYEKEEVMVMNEGRIKDGIPDLRTWLCLRPKLLNQDFFKE